MLGCSSQTRIENEVFGMPRCILNSLLFSIRVIASRDSSASFSLTEWHL